MMAKAQAPSDVKIQIRNDSYQPAADGMSTHRKHDVGIRANIRSQQNAGQETGGKVRLVVEYSATRDFERSGFERSEWGGSRTATVRLRNLSENTQYFTKIRVEQRNRNQLSNARQVDFYTERRPYAPRLDEPADNASVNEGGTIVFRWKHQDADDPPDAQAKAELRWRKAATILSPPGEWHTVRFNDGVDNYELDTADLGGNLHYDWEVRTRDGHATRWSPWAFRSFYLIGATTPPEPTYPLNDEAASTDDGMTFRWRFRDPDPGETQAEAQLRFRVANIHSDPQEGWTLLSAGAPGSVEEWAVAPGVIQPGFRYEWQVQTRNSTVSLFSAWSRSGFFRAIRQPGWAVRQDDTVPVSVPQGSLGTGEYRLFAYDQGGQRYRGELPKLKFLQWTRVRDDISTCTLRTNGFGEDGGRLLSELHSWVHEIAVYRNGERVWEGPITRPAHHHDHVEISAHDVMAYPYRRIMRQGYNDNFRRPQQGIEGSRSVVERASIILQNVLAPWDPNVLPYLTVVAYPDDARQARSVADWSKTAWEEIDDMAATAGLDYTTVGRRIILHDTHRPIGLLAELTDQDFFEKPVITEYGMSAANVFGVTSNTGVYGKFEFPVEDWFGAGPIEMLASAYGEGVDTPADPRTLTRKQRQDLEEVLDGQAARNINGRWASVRTVRNDDDIEVGPVYGSPRLVRVPDNSRMHPDAYVGINQLVPGVHAPLRVKNPTAELAQVQKLDSVTVIVENGEEKIQTTWSPAPLGDLDPDQLGVDVE